MPKCTLCPRECGADREKERGFCGADNRIRIARAAKHMWEEPVISGKNGSGTIFFSGCSLACEFCQNFVLSHENQGIVITPARFYDIMFELKAQGAVNINLVTADHYIPYIVPVLRHARQDGLGIPVVFNTSSYLKLSALKQLKDAVDIYLADLKFSSPAAAMKYCSAPDYPQVARAAIEQMVKKVGRPVIRGGIMQKGVIVRVLVMPGNLIDAKASIKYLYDTYGDDIYISVMGQYVPMPHVTHRELKSALSPSAYRSVVRYAQSLGITNGFVQGSGADDKIYIPEFNCEGV
ncbi:MAG: radical SAM protein [Clostridia bacterium]|nr:radical SAM protein [Clostridia bacterium]